MTWSRAPTKVQPNALPNGRTDTMEGTRVATVGIATFSVSLFAAIWILMCVIGRLTRQTWYALSTRVAGLQPGCLLDFYRRMYFVGGVMLAIVVIIFVASPRKSGAGESADQVRSCTSAPQCLSPSTGTRRHTHLSHPHHLQVYTFYHLNIGIVGAIVFVTALAATCCVGCWESMTMRRAKVIVDRE